MQIPTAEQMTAYELMLKNSEVPMHRRMMLAAIICSETASALIGGAFQYGQPGLPNFTAVSHVLTEQFSLAEFEQLERDVIAMFDALPPKPIIPAKHH